MCLISKDLSFAIDVKKGPAPQIMGQLGSKCFQSKLLYMYQKTKQGREVQIIYDLFVKRVFFLSGMVDDRL